MIPHKAYRIRSFSQALTHYPATAALPYAILDSMLFADALLARRIEAAEAANARGCSASPDAGPPDLLEIGGGCAIFVGAESPLTQAVGIGLNGPVAESTVEEIEEFFHSRGARVSIDLCPLADPGLIETLGRRGYRASEFNNVLARRLAGAEIVFTPRGRRATATERDLWSYTVGLGFFEQPELTTEELNVGRAIFEMPGALCYLAVTENGELAGGGASAHHAGVATMFADSIMPRYRRLGLHRELIAARLNEALAQGCDLAAASTLPGGQSQRNYERLGFEVVYTKVTMAR